MSEQKDNMINVVQVTFFDGVKYSYRTDKPMGEVRLSDIIKQKKGSYQSLSLRQRRALEIKHINGKASICISKQVKMTESEYYKNPAVKAMGVKDEQKETKTGPVFTNIKSTISEEH